MGKDKLLIIQRADTGPVITLYYIISKFRWVIRLVINSLHEQVLTTALCISNTTTQSSTHKSAMCANVRTPQLRNSPLSLLSEMGSASVILCGDRRSRGKPGGVMVGQRAVYYHTPHLLIQIWVVELSLLYLIKPASWNILPLLFQAVLSFPCVYAESVEREGVSVLLKLVFAHLWRVLKVLQLHKHPK